MRKLATIRTVQSIEPIKGKDRVELAHVDGWTCMVSKADSFTVGSLCIFCEPDSVFPANDQWKFLEKYSYRIKTQKFKDADGNLVYSQGLVLPLSVLPNMEYKYDEDVTSVLGITQYEPTIVFTNINLSKTTVEDVLKLANGKSELYDTLREGLVFRSKDGRKSFKAVSPEFSIKHGE